MAKLKVMTILGTRPEIIRLSSIIKKFNNFFDHKLVNTGQNFDNKLNKFFYKELDLKKPDYNLNCKSKNPSEFLSQLFFKIDKVLDKENPDAVVILGDTNSALSSICVKKKKIPIFHLEAGNRCFDQRVPEEINRKIVDHISDMNLTYSSYANENLVLEGISKDRIIKIGSPLMEVYLENFEKIQKNKICERLNLKKDKYIIASIHREENVSNFYNFKVILDSLLKIKDKNKCRIIFSTHPRTKQKLKEYKNIYKKHIEFHNPFGYLDFVCLMKNSMLVISDSGSISEEASIMSIPAINIRFANERQEAMELGTVIMTGICEKNILRSSIIAIEKGKKNIEVHVDYSKTNVSSAIVAIVQSYTHYIKSKTWFKN
jgi:UDP-N-acetylglucosamine 2-epimerase